MNRRAWLLVALWLLLWAAWQGTHLDAFSFDYDEGVYLMQARLVREGVRLYRDMPTLFPPLWFWTAAGTFALFGATVTVGRLLSLAYALVGAGSVAALGRRLGGGWGVLLAVLLFTLSPHVLIASRSVMLDLPAVSLALLALALAVHAGPRPAWWAGAGAVFAASLMVKPVVPATIIPLVWLALAAPRTHWPRRLGALVLGVTVPTAAIILLSTPRLFWEQTLAIRGVMRVVFPWNPATNLLLIWQEGLWPSLGALVLGLAGFWMLRRDRVAQALMLWVLATLITFVFHTPLYPHHLIVFPATLAPPVAGSLRLLHPFTWRHPLARAGVVAVVAVLLGLPIATGQVAASYADDAGWNDTLAQLIDFIAKHAGTDQQVVTDYPMLAFRADRSVPPILADSSDGRITSGSLDATEAIEATARAQPPVIVPWSGRFERLPEYIRWVEDNYVIVGCFDDEGQRPVYGPRQYAADFGGKIRLTMADVERRKLAPGDHFRATLVLQSLAPMTINYNVLVRLVAADGRELWREEDWPWGAPTADWPPDEFRFDGHEIAIPADAPPGLYALTVSFYDPATFAPLVITPPESDQPTGEAERVVALIRVGPPPTAERLFDPAPQFHEPLSDGSLRPVAALAGVTLPVTTAPGSELPLALLWESRGHTLTDYTVFVHIVGPDGAIVAQQDRPPLAGLAPTHLWKPEERLLDEYRFSLLTSLRAGTYPVHVGLYSLAQGRRLPVTQNGTPAGDYVTIGALIVK